MFSIPWYVFNCPADGLLGDKATGRGFEVQADFKS